MRAHFVVSSGRNSITPMNRTTLTFALAAAALWAGTVHAQAPVASPVAQPASPAPTVTPAPAPAVNPPSVAATTQASVVVQGQAGAATSSESAPTRVSQIVYTPQLPSAAELTNAAAAQGFEVERIVQTANQVIAFYRNASGQPTTVAYQNLPPTGVVSTPAPAPVVVTAPPPAVIYNQAPRVVYYDDYPGYYYPRVWYPPVSLRLGFGFRSFHGGHHGGYRHR